MRGPDSHIDQVAAEAPGEKELWILPQIVFFRNGSIAPASASIDAHGFYFIKHEYEVT
jgi:hypothetical protein